MFEIARKTVAMMLLKRWVRLSSFGAAAFCLANSREPIAENEAGTPPKQRSGQEYQKQRG